MKNRILVVALAALALALGIFVFRADAAFNPKKGLANAFKRAAKARPGSSIQNFVQLTANKPGAQRGLVALYNLGKRAELAGTIKKGLFSDRMQVALGRMFDDLGEAKTIAFLEDVDKVHTWARSAGGNNLNALGQTSANFATFGKGHSLGAAYEIKQAAKYVPPGVGGAVLKEIQPRVATEFSNRSFRDLKITKDGKDILVEVKHWTKMPNSLGKFHLHAQVENHFKRLFLSGIESIDGVPPLHFAFGGRTPPNEWVKAIGDATSAALKNKFNLTDTEVLDWINDNMNLGTLIDPF